MKSFSRVQGGACVWLLLLLAGISGCTFKATLETSSNGTTNFLSSTTGKTWWTENGLVKQHEQARVFVATNYDNLLQEIAQGEGDYVHAFGTLLGVRSHQQAPFQRVLQSQYSALVEISLSHREDQLNRFIVHLQQAWIQSMAPNL